MAKRPSLFAPKPATPAAAVAAETKVARAAAATEERPEAVIAEGTIAGRPPSRAGKRMFSVYLDPLALKQIHQLRLDRNSSNQALGEEAINLLFEKYGLNRSA